MATNDRDAPQLDKSKLGSERPEERPLRLPRFYVDRVVVCRQCGQEEVWPAARQKWWYEVAKGNINTEAMLCRACRKADQTRREEARRRHLEGLARTRRFSETEPRSN
ncbi:MAG: hypothetical protein EOM91_20290 [Sphingobacteriia bacterium]|nr:hypothetical protein [Sphingobacteriia bacterium]